MKDISSIVVDFIEKTVTDRGLELYRIGGQDVYIAMDRNCNTAMKFDMSFSDRAFVCQTLVHSDGELMLDRSVNIAWTDGASLREFFKYIDRICPSSAGC